MKEWMLSTKEEELVKQCCAFTLDDTVYCALPAWIIKYLLAPRSFEPLSEEERYCVINIHKWMCILFGEEQHKTVSWCDREKLEQYLKVMKAGDRDIWIKFIWEIAEKSPVELQHILLRLSPFIGQHLLTLTWSHGQQCVRLKEETVEKIVRLVKEACTERPPDIGDYFAISIKLEVTGIDWRFSNPGGRISPIPNGHWKPE